MMQPLFFGALLAIGAVLFALARRIRPSIVGALLLLAGAGVFAVRLVHEGPYPFPRGPDLVYGSANLLIGLWLLLPAARRRLLPRRIVLALSPLLLCFASAGILHEAEEVVVLRTPDAQGDVLATRLWVVDHDGAAWVVTGRKSEPVRRLTAIPRVELVRGGRVGCYIASPYNDRETLETALRLRQEKYFAQRLAVAVGLWPDSLDGIEEIAVAVRLDPCPE